MLFRPRPRSMYGSAFDRIDFLIAFIKPEYLNFYIRSTIILHRLFSQTTLYFQEIYLLFSNANESFSW